jgi:CheY-like chemotaxis protein
MTTTGSSWILLVEDDDSLRNIVAELLEQEGYVVREAANGQAALDVLSSHEQGAWPCVILLDLMMPLMNGFEFRERQLQAPALAAIPVVIFSANGPPQARVTELRASGELKKPIHLDDLIREVERYCGARPRL